LSTGHETEEVVFGHSRMIFCEVDIEMVPFIKWMNSIMGICTTSCCRGSGSERPLVIFEIAGIDTLAFMSTVINLFVMKTNHQDAVLLQVHGSIVNPLTFNLSFSDLDAMNGFLDFALQTKLAWSHVPTWISNVVNVVKSP
jgi:hypothetical protein